MKAGEIVKREIARQIDFGYEPSYEDMVIIGYEAGIEEARNRLHSQEVFEVTAEALAEQRQAGIREVVEWGLETCPHGLFGEGTQCFKRVCDECWEIKIKEWNNG